jgi:ribosome-associated toxin RatA of RatAB toxin-antitoxin module
MTTITRSALVPYSDRQMFDLVADVERYPQFLPWCGGAQVLEQSEGRQVATITIAFKGIRQAFTTENALEPPQRIVLTLRHGPFTHLDGEWRFKALRADACRIDFKLEYAMRSGLLARLLGPIFGQIAQTMVDAFVKRAAALAGD